MGTLKNGVTKKHFKMIGHRGVQPCTDRESKEKVGPARKLGLM